MRFRIAKLLILAAMLATPGAALAATAAVVTTDLNIRTGPAADYQRYGTIPAGDTVRVFGCLDGYGWCDVAWAGERGWVHGAYLATLGRRYYREPISTIGIRIGVPVYGFDPYDYHRRYYAGRSWYHDRYRDGRPERDFRRDRDFGRDRDARRGRDFERFDRDRRDAFRDARRDRDRDQGLRDFDRDARDARGDGRDARRGERRDDRRPIASDDSRIAVGRSDAEIGRRRGDLRNAGRGEERERDDGSRRRFDARRGADEQGRPPLPPEE